MTRTAGSRSNAWDAVAAGQREPQFQKQIALYKRRRNLDLVAAWAPAHVRVALKTDLFEEAFGSDALLDALGGIYPVIGRMASPTWWPTPRSGG